MNPQTTGVDSEVSRFGFARGLSPSTVAGLVLVPLGAWVALEPFLFGGWAWEWELGRFLLTVVPGAAAMLGGLIMLTGRRPAVVAGGGLALAGGLWLLLAPVAFAVVAGHELGTVSGGESVRLLQWMPFFFCAGALVSLVSAYGLALIAPMQFADEEFDPAREALAEPAGTATRRRIPAPPERQRRQRGVKEPVARRDRNQTRAQRPRRDS